MNIEQIKSQVAINASRVKKLGNWPDYVDEMSLVHRIPDERDNRLTAPGFDAGIACCLDLIPRDKQKLSAVLHGAYTPEAIEQIRKEVEILYSFFRDTVLLDSPEKINAANLETCWWLAACFVCNEGDCDSNTVLNQIDHFKQLKENMALRISAALECYNKMKENFHIVDNVAVALKDGGMQAAYINGIPLAIMPAYGTWFVGTFYDSLGIPENFKWNETLDNKGRPMSGPVFGSKQFVKCSTFDELNKVLEYSKKYLKEKL